MGSIIKTSGGIRCAPTQFENVSKRLKDVDISSFSLTTTCAGLSDDRHELYCINLSIDGVLVAWIHWHIEPLRVYIADLFVDRHLRGRGLGTRLMQHVLDECGCKPMYLIASPMDPIGIEKLRSWYESFGFRYVSGDSIYMWRSECQDF